MLGWWRLSYFMRLKVEDVEGTALAESYYENLIELRKQKPEVFNVLSPAVKISLQHYEKQKRLNESLNEERLICLD